jgi:hypothetical protein
MSLVTVNGHNGSFHVHGGASFGALGPVQLIPKEYKKQGKMELFFNNSARPDASVLS